MLRGSAADRAGMEPGDLVVAVEGRPVESAAQLRNELARAAVGSRLQVFPGPGSEAMQHLPWSFVPTVLVPIYLILHAIVWVQLRSRVEGSHAAR